MLFFIFKLLILFFIISFIFKVGKLYGKVEKSRKNIKRKKDLEVEEADYEEIE